MQFPQFGTKRYEALKTSILYKLYDENDDATKFPDPCYEGKKIKVEELDEADCQVDFTSTLEAILSFI